MKNWKKRICMLLCLIFVLVFVTACGNRDEVGLGDTAVVSLGSAIGQTGGGIDPEEKFAGTRHVADTTVDYTVTHICYTPQRAIVKDLKIPMINMKNQQLTFDGTINFMLNAKYADVMIGGFRNYRPVIASFYRDSMRNVLAPLNMGLEEDVYANSGGEFKSKIPANRSFDDRGAISQRIFEDFMARFSKKYAKYMNCFIFLGNTVNNVDFDKKVLTALEEAVGKQYKKSELTVVQTIKDLEGQIQVAKSDADLEAYGKEAGALTPEVMSYLGDGLMDDIITNPHIDAEILIGISPDGRIAFFKEPLSGK